MSQSNADPRSDHFKNLDYKPIYYRRPWALPIRDQTITIYMHSFGLCGEFKPYDRLKNRSCLFLNKVLYPHTYNTSPNHDYNYCISELILATEMIATNEDYWGIIVEDSANIPHNLLISIGYKYEPKTKVYEKLLKGFTTQEFNDPKELTKYVEKSEAWD